MTRSFTLETDQSNLFVLHDGGDAGVSVLLPGCGPCWVPHSSIIPVTVASQQREPRSIRHIMMRDVTTESSAPCLALLKLVGKGIEHLELQTLQFKLVLPPSWLLDAIAACRNVHQLTIEKSKIAGIDEILDACEAGALRLTLLVIERCPISGDLTSFFRLFEALGNAKHPLAKTLRSLTLVTHGLSALQKAEWERMLGVWVAMLERNSVLRLSRWQSFGLTSRRKHFAALFAKFEGQVLAGREGPVEIRSKLAFISTLSINQVDLASDLLSKIFQFAAPRETRTSQYFN